MKQEGCLKRCNAISTRPRPEVTKWNGSLTGYSENTLKLLKKKWDAPQHIMNKLWQMMQSRDTKNLNLDKDFEEIKGTVKQGGTSRPGQKDSGDSTKMKICSLWSLVLKLQDGRHNDPGCQVVLL